jgi:stearoyl-CoA desaturase (delta-9 desaturase)
MEKFGHGTPDDWIERNIYSKYGWQGVGIMLIIDVLLFGAIGLTVWAVQMAWIPSGRRRGQRPGPLWGYRNYDCADAATNLFPIGIIIGGEELHNNHHTFAPRPSSRPSGTSSTSAGCTSASWKPSAWPRSRRCTGAQVRRQKSVIDFDTLQSVIANRYDVMAKYARSLKSAWKDELDHLIEKAQLESRFLKSSKKLLQREPAA